ncbi:YigZ family protein [Streptococcus dentasini]
MNYKTIARDNIIEDVIKKSRFICHVKRVTSESEARDYIAQIKRKHYKASHSCSAMILGEKSDIKRSSDDGEPSGTAGIPMLGVLEKQELTNIVAVVTRYFGGIKLGAGGLIRAYAGIVAHTISETGLVQIKEQEGLQLELSYPQYQTFANFLAAEGLQEFHTSFSDKVETVLYVDPEDLADCLAHLREFYSGKVIANRAGRQVVEVPIS